MHVSRIRIPEKCGALFKNAPFKVQWGGRGSGKSQGSVDAMLVQDMQKQRRTLCAREFQSSIKDSLHRLIVDEIYRLNLQGFYHKITERSIIGRNGSEYLFKGLRKDINSIRSLQGIARTLVEEAQTVTKQSWDVLIPTVMRREDSEMWLNLNPDLETDETFQRFIAKQRPNSIVTEMNWRDNPFFPEKLEEERLWTLETDPDAYENIWNGRPRIMSEAAIFGGKRWSIGDFEAPEGTTFYYGADWGFAVDPTVLIRCYIEDDNLFIDQEAWQVGIPIDETAALFAGNPGPGHAWTNPRGFDGIPGATIWPIKGDGANPQIIDYLRRQGLNISAAEKWPGSVLDGIAHLKAFRNIYIHTRCKRTAEEFRLYSWKTDAKTKRILPIPAGRWDHCIDALRYSLDGFIQSRGEETVWKRLLGQ